MAIIWFKADHFKIKAVMDCFVLHAFEGVTCQHECWKVRNGSHTDKSARYCCFTFFHTDTIDIGCPFQETSILASACALREDKSGLFIDETEGQLVSLLSCGDWSVFSTCPCIPDVNIKISLRGKTHSGGAKVNHSNNINNNKRDKEITLQTSKQN